MNKPVVIFILCHNFIVLQEESGKGEALDNPTIDLETKGTYDSSWL